MAPCFIRSSKCGVRWKREATLFCNVILEGTIIFAVFYNEKLVHILGPTHIQREEITQGSEYEEAGIVIHFRSYPQHIHTIWCHFSSVLFSRSVVSDSLWPHGPQHSRLPCPSPTPRVHPNPGPLSQWCHPTISSSVIPFSSCLQSFPASGSFQMSQLFASGGQRIGVSASTSVLPMNTKDWSPLGWTGWTSLQSKGLSRVFSNTTLQKHRFFSAQLSL